jgi:hypothetical protein
MPTYILEEKRLVRFFAEDDFLIFDDLLHHRFRDSSGSEGSSQKLVTGEEFT